MDAIIKTGFQKITHHINFQPQTLPKAKALVDAGHVIHVQELRKNGESYLVQASVIRQTSVTLEPYHVELHVSFIVLLNVLLIFFKLIYYIILYCSLIQIEM